MQHNARVDIVDKRKRNALHYAVEAGSAEACEVILDNAQTRGCSAEPGQHARTLSWANQCFLVRGKKVAISAVLLFMLSRYHVTAYSIQLE